MRNNGFQNQQLNDIVINEWLIMAIVCHWRWKSVHNDVGVNSELGQ